MRGELRHSVYKGADPTHFNLYRIAVLHPRDACGRSSRNQVTGIQCHDLRDVPYKKGDRKCHVSRVAFLFYFAVETCLDGHAARIALSLEPRTPRATRVKRLTASELDVFALQVARSDVVHARVAKDVAERIVGLGNVVGETSDYNAEFSFVLDLL